MQLIQNPKLMVHAAACWLALGCLSAYAAQRLQVRTLSGRPDMGTGGGALVEIFRPAANRATASLNGRDITASFRRDREPEARIVRRRTEARQERVGGEGGRSARDHRAAC